MHLTFIIPVEQVVKSLATPPDILEYGIIEIDANVHLRGLGEQPDLDYTYIKFNGTNVLPLLDGLPAAGGLMQFFFKETHKRARQKHLRQLQYNTSWKQ